MRLKLLSFVAAISQSIAHFGKEWERSRAASAYGIIWGGGTQVKTNMAEFSVECHSVDSSCDSKVLTELQIAITSRLLL